jgi:hypothetical protein
MRSLITLAVSTRVERALVVGRTRGSGHGDSPSGLASTTR